MIEIKVPTVGESISEVSLAEWKVAEGEYVKRDQVICELESEKATFELNAEQAGTVTYVAAEGDDLNIGDVVCKIDETAKAPEGTTAETPEKSSDKDNEESEKGDEESGEEEKNTNKTNEGSKETTKTEAAKKTSREPKMVELVVPTIGESITEVTLSEWKVAEGDYVKRDQIICEFESEKATLDFPSEQAGIITFVAQEGEDLEIGAVVCKIDTSAEAPDDEAEATTSDKKQEVKDSEKKSADNKKESEPKDEKPAHEDVKPGEIEFRKPPAEVRATPIAKQMISENKVDGSKIKGSGPEGRITKNDVLEFLAAPIDSSKKAFTRDENRKKMSKLRRTISRRLVEAKNTTAMLTTFNEVDMSAVKNLREQYKEEFQKKHGIGLGFMSFFARACAIALQEWPSVNAYIDGEEIIYHDYVDISIAVSAPKGLVVPVIRNAESLTMDGIEKEVKRLATKARDNKLELEEMQGGTFTLTNGGVFGSLLSTPILNLPQSAILGMHKIEDRPIAVEGQVVIRPMMYLALSYDHRIIDGRESVGFLVRVKELLEDPTKMIAAKPVDQVLLDL